MNDWYILWCVQSHLLLSYISSSITFVLHVDHVRARDMAIASWNSAAAPQLTGLRHRKLRRNGWIPIQRPSHFTLWWVLRWQWLQSLLPLRLLDKLLSTVSERLGPALLLLAREEGLMIPLNCWAGSWLIRLREVFIFPAKRGVYIYIYICTHMTVLYNSISICWVEFSLPLLINQLAHSD